MVFVDNILLTINHPEKVSPLLPPGVAEYPKRWGRDQKHFTQSWLASGGSEKPGCNLARIGAYKSKKSVEFNLAKNSQHKNMALH